MQEVQKLGVGLGYRDEIAEEISANADAIDFLEIIPESYFGRPKVLEDLKSQFTVIPHAVDLSVGAVDFYDKKYLKKLRKLIELLDPPYWSEHVSFSNTNAHSLGHLSPVSLTKTSLNVLVDNVNRVLDEIQKPLILENITYSVNFGESAYSQAGFLNEMCERTGCGLLLDVTNLYINSHNHKFSKDAFLDELDLSRVVQLHIIGFEESEGYLIDTHGAPVQEELWQLYENILQKAEVKGVIIEWDKHFPEDFSKLMLEVQEGKKRWK